MKDKTAREEVEAEAAPHPRGRQGRKDALPEFMKKATEAQADGQYAEAESSPSGPRRSTRTSVAAVALEWKARTERHYKKDKQTRS